MVVKAKETVHMVGAVVLVAEWQFIPMKISSLESCKLLVDMVQPNMEQLGQSIMLKHIEITPLLPIAH